MEEGDQLSGETLDALSRGIVRLKAELYGRGPEAARAFQNGEFVFCVMKGGLTTVERTLLEAKDEPLVRHVRLRFQEAVRPQFIEVVEQVTGRRVLTYQSQIMFDPDYVVEMFVLSPR
ncbi:MAG TPA: Na-translocating system protein MpsC family protein [Thermoleophilaceae bacterium]|jgi:uncharacterized protein YbcI